MTFTPPPRSPNFKPGVGRIVTDRYDFEAHLEGVNPPYATNFRHHADQVDMAPLVNIDGYFPPNVQEAIELLAGLINPSVVQLATSSAPGIIRLNGDLNGSGSSALNPRVGAIQGFAISTLSPSSGQVLSWNGTAWTPSSFSPSGSAGGDLSGSFPNPTVSGLQGRPVSSTAPSTSQVLTWNGSAWVPGSGFTGAAGGDLSGTYPNPTVAGIRGQSVPAPSGSNTVLSWNGSSLSWAAGGAAGAAGGDLSGTYPNPTVSGLQGHAVSSTAPTTGQVLEWNGTNWAPITLSSSTPPATISSLGTVQLAGDLGGSGTSAAAPKVGAIQGNTITSGALTKGQFFVATSTSNWAATTLSGDLSESSVSPGLVSVIGLQGHAVANTTPSTNQVLTWNGSQWAPANAPPPSGAAGGDLSGTYPNPTVARIQGNTVTAGGLTKGSFLVATSTSNWASTILTGDISESAATPGQLTVVGLQGHGVSTSAPTTNQALVFNGSLWAPGSVTAATGPSNTQQSGLVTMSSTAVITVVSMTLTAPSLGFVVINVAFDGISTVAEPGIIPTSVSVGLNVDNSTSINTSRTLHFFFDGNTSGTWYSSTSLNARFGVAAGTHTIYALAQIPNAFWTSIQVQASLSATFVSS